MGIICDTCGRDIDALGQDNMGVDAPLCEDCLSSCTTSKRLLASFCEEADYLEWLKAEYDDGTVEWEER